MYSIRVTKFVGLCFLVAYQLNSLFIFMIFLFDVQLRNKYDDDNDVVHGMGPGIIDPVKLT